ncbi:RING-type domain-containing protein, partial [Pseudozyma hubeiensis]
CEVCYKSVIAEGGTGHDLANGANGSFWICELPAPVQRYLQPFDTSIAELMNAHHFTHMSNLISHLKSKLFEQKRLLNHIKQDFERKSSLQRDLDAARRENAALKEEIQVLRSSPLKTEPGSSTGKASSQRSSHDMADANRLRPPSRSTSIQQPQQILQRPSSQASASQTRAPFNMTLRDVRPQASRPPTAQSTSGSELFAFKPPPLPFRAREPQVSRLANAGLFLHY